MKLVITLALFLTTNSALANGDTILAQLHGLERVGERLCMTDLPFNTWHYHYGAGNSEEEAIDSWESFTQWEYGPRFGSFAKAHDIQVKCTDFGSEGLSCSATGIPCR